MTQMSELIHEVSELFVGRIVNQGELETMYKVLAILHALDQSNQEKDNRVLN
jgi:hypothetical protein